MIQTSNLLVLFFLAGSTYAVFYTKSKDSEYPRIGRRSFYTSGSGYPRIGRRSDGSSGYPELGAFEKRGLYTSSGGYPRVGRSGTDAVWQQARSKLLRNIAALGGSVGEQAEEALSAGSSSGSDDQGNGYAGDDLLFMAFDENDDNQLSKQEFTRGMEKYRRENPMC